MAQTPPSVGMTEEAAGLEAGPRSRRQGWKELRRLLTWFSHTGHITRLACPRQLRTQ